jgi:hypothetical protein
MHCDFRAQCPSFPGCRSVWLDFEDGFPLSKGFGVDHPLTDNGGTGWIIKLLEHLGRIWTPLYLSS